MSVKVSKISLTIACIFFFSATLSRVLFFFVQPGPLENFLGEVLVLQFKIFLLIMGYSFNFFVQNPAGLKILVIITIIFILRFTALIINHRKFWPLELSPILAAIVLPAQFFSDLSFPLFCAFMVILLVVPIIPRLNIFTFRINMLIFPFMNVIALAFLDWAEMAALITFSGITALCTTCIRREIIPLSGALLLLLVLTPLFQILSAWLPTQRPPMGSTRFSNSLALSFCASKDRKTVFAVHPECPMAMFTEQCRNGFIAEYDSETLMQKNVIRPFDGNYWGRPEQIICSGERLFVSVNEAMEKRRRLGPNAMLIKLSGNTAEIQKNIAGPQIGNSLLYDAQRDALYMASEWDQRIYRWGFRENRIQSTIGDQLPNSWYWPLTGKTQTGSRILHHDGISQKYNAFYASEWINGRYVHEIDIDSQKLKRRFRFNGGASVGSTVDEEFRLLWVTHAWGISVFNLESGNLVAKHRAGFVNRPAVIDKTNGFVYFASTTRGRIFAYDRRSAKPLGTLVSGLGSRYLHFSPETNKLFAGTVTGSYVFDLSPESEIVRRLRGAK